MGTFLVNADVLQAFGVNDLETSEHLSRLTSEATIAVENENTSSNPCVSDQWRYADCDDKPSRRACSVRTTR